MPSGSHGGRRGSSSSSRMSGSFSRSSSSSRSSSFGGSSRGYVGGGYHRHHHGPIRIRFGRRYYIYTGGSSALGLLVALFFFLLFGTFITSDIKNAAKSEIVNLEEEYYYYQNMIDYAKEHPAYQVEAKVTGRFYDDSMDKWYVTYELETFNGNTSDGYTFTHYTTTEIYRIIVGTNIDVAVDSSPIDYRTDSINMDYENVSLEDVGEYVVAKKEAKTRTIIWAIFVILDIVLVLGVVLYIRKKMKKEDDKEEKKEETKIDSNIICCKYCGTISDKGTKKCPGCGAGLRK